MTLIEQIKTDLICAHPFHLCHQRLYLNTKSQLPLKNNLLRFAF